MKKDGLSTIVKELQGASKMHLRQSKEIEKHIDDMSPVDRTAAEVKKTLGDRADAVGKQGLEADNINKTRRKFQREELIRGRLEKKVARKIKKGDTSLNKE